MPKTILSDKGSELRSFRVQNFYRKNGIRQIYNENSIHAPFVERFNRTLQSLIYKFLTKSGSYRFCDKLDDILNTYNSRKHRMIQIR